MSVNPIESTPAPKFGVYVHVPFCFRRCPYCDFAIAVRKKIPHEEYEKAVLSELRSRRHEYEGRRADTLYFGGGTPSLWRADCISSVIEEVTAVFGEPGEVTVEVNPEELSDALLNDLRSAGVNRLSLGVQTFDPDVLQHLGRRHSATQGRDATERALSAGFAKLNVDLITGSAAQTRDAFFRDLEVIADLGVQHVSVYGLTIEERTPFGRRAARGERLSVDDEEMADRYEAAVGTLSKVGVTQYEVSNYSVPGAWSHHNLLYWLGGEYLGLGLGAHSLWRDQAGGARRRANTADLRRYLADRPHEAEELSPAVHLAERFFLHLRTRCALDPRTLERQWDAQDVARYLKAIEPLIGAGLIALDGERLVATPRGLALHDTIAEAVVRAMPEAATSTGQ